MFLIGIKKKKPKKMNDFGKVLANIRIENSETLRNQSKKIGISASLLCAYSYGERRVNPAIAYKLFTKYEKLSLYSCEVIMAEIYGSELLERLLTMNPEWNKKHALEFEIAIIVGVEYVIS